MVLPHTFNILDGKTKFSLTSPNKTSNVKYQSMWCQPALQEANLSVSLQSCVWLCVRPCVWVPVCVYESACVCMSVCAHVCLCVCACVHVCTWVRVYRQMYTYHTWVITAQNFPAIISRYKGHLMFRGVQEKGVVYPYSIIVPQNSITHQQTLEGNMSVV